MLEVALVAAHLVSIEVFSCCFNRQPHYSKSSAILSCCIQRGRCQKADILHFGDMSAWKRFGQARWNVSVLTSSHSLSSSSSLLLWSTFSEATFELLCHRVNSLKIFRVSSRAKLYRVDKKSWENLRNWTCTIRLAAGPFLPLMIPLSVSPCDGRVVGRFIGGLRLFISTHYF